MRELNADEIGVVAGGQNEGEEVDLVQDKVIVTGKRGDGSGGVYVYTPSTGEIDFFTNLGAISGAILGGTVGYYVCPSTGAAAAACMSGTATAGGSLGIEASEATLDWIYDVANSSSHMSETEWVDFHEMYENSHFQHSF
ncbi:MAG: hypothetical protein AAF292_15500 [Pseudomonadota bacterium]